MAAPRQMQRGVFWPLMAAALAVAAAVWLVLADTSNVRIDEAVTPAVPSETPVSVWQPRPRPTTPAPGCAARASAQCLQGDLWWFDSCGIPHEKADECGLRPCHDGGCEEDDPSACADVPGLGECDGEVARGCNVGRSYAIDCEARNQRCVMTDEGPACRDRTTHDCTATDIAHCDGNVLVTCVEGREQRLACEDVGGRCQPGRGGTLRCVRPMVAADEACGPCGCPPETLDEELCNGRDDDGDGFVDEDVDCGEVDIVAFVLVDDDGNGSYTDDDIEDEVARVSAAFARDDDLGLRFRLADILRLSEPQWLELDDEETQDVLISGAFNPQRETFYVPLVFTDQVLIDEVPRPGLATPPNGMCGGQRRTDGQQPPLGAVIIGKRRWESTVAHEIGHFFGLCHTHMPPGPTVERAPASGENGESCEELCSLEGDGVCDTPPDPGPESCETDPECSIHCRDAARPDPTNIMGYYPSCRNVFSTEQAQLMRHALHLRRGWHACFLGEGCTCAPVGAACPEGMTCRPYEDPQGSVWRCGLDGSSVPAGACKSPGDCSRGSLCIEGPSGASSCVRPCAVPAADCDCRHAGFEVPLCADDFH